MEGLDRQRDLCRGTGNCHTGWCHFSTATTALVGDDRLEDHASHLDSQRAQDTLSLTFDPTRDCLPCGHASQSPLGAAHNDILATEQLNAINHVEALTILQPPFRITLQFAMTGTSKCKGTDRERRPWTESLLRMTGTENPPRANPGTP